MRSWSWWDKHVTWIHSPRFRPDGRVCMAGFLGGGAAIASFDPLMHMPSGVHLSFFASAFTFGQPDYPLSDVPLSNHRRSRRYGYLPGQGPPGYFALTKSRRHT